MTNKIETALTNFGVTYTDVENDILQDLDTKYFKTHRELVGIEIVIPDDSAADYFYWEPPTTLFIEQYLNLNISRLADVNLTYTSSSSYSSVEPDKSSEYTAYRHGTGFIFETQSTSQTIVLNCLTTPKQRDDLHDEMRLLLMYAYYYLYVSNNASFYNYIRKISTMKKNIRNQREQNKPKVKSYYGQIEAYEL